MTERPVTGAWQHSARASVVVGLRAALVDEINNLKAFLATARVGSFSRAAREIGVAPSVITKRIGQLEWKLRTLLFTRSTRRVELTPVGQELLPRARTFVNDYDEMLRAMTRPPGHLRGRIRMKAPLTLTILYLGEVLNQFQEQHPDIAIDLELIDHPVNPVEEGFDIAVGGFSPAFEGVIDIPLCSFRRLVCASPHYVARRGAPQHPKDLVSHECLCFKATGNTWSFDSPRGPISVTISPRLIVNDGNVLRDAALAGHGALLISSYVVEPWLASGALMPILQEFSVPDMWFKVTLPEAAANSPVVTALLDWLKLRFATDPLWNSAILPTPAVGA